MKDAMKDLTLMLLYLSSWEEKDLPTPYRRSWKGYAFDILDELSEEGLISDGRKSKSVYLGDEGIARAKELLGQYGIKEETLFQ